MAKTEGIGWVMTPSDPRQADGVLNREEQKKDKVVLFFNRYI